MRPLLLPTSHFMIAGGVLLQALLAGLFLSGNPGARITHLIVGTILPYLAFVPAVAAWVRRRQGAVTRLHAIGATVVLLGLWVQEALGHMPFPVTTAVHVPLGVALFGLSLQLGFQAVKSPEGA